MCVNVLVVSKALLLRAALQLQGLAVYTMRLTNITHPGAVPASPEFLAISVFEPPQLEEFLTLVDTTFQVAQATYLQDPKEFKAMPRESLLQMADRYNEFAMPLVGAGLMTSRNLALNLR